MASDFLSNRQSFEFATVLPAKFCKLTLTVVGKICRILHFFPKALQLRSVLSIAGRSDCITFLSIFISIFTPSAICHFDSRSEMLQDF